MTNELNPIFDKLTTHLIAGNSPLVHLFQGGIDRPTVDANLQGLNITLPEEVYSLYNWHNGIRDTEDYTFGQLWFFPLGMFSPVERSVEGYKYYAGKDGYWQPSMFMLFEGGGGEMFLIDCDKNSPAYRQILKHDYGAVDHDIVTPVFDSMEALLASVIECFEKKAFWHNDKGGLKFDINLEVPIMKKNNPRSTYWDMDFAALNQART